MSGPQAEQAQRGETRAGPGGPGGAGESRRGLPRLGSLGPAAFLDGAFSLLRNSLSHVRTRISAKHCPLYENATVL